MSKSPYREAASGAEVEVRYPTMHNTISDLVANMPEYRKAYLAARSQTTEYVVPANGKEVFEFRSAGAIRVDANLFIPTDLFIDVADPRPNTLGMYFDLLGRNAEAIEEWWGGPLPVSIFTKDFAPFTAFRCIKAGGIVTFTFHNVTSTDIVVRPVLRGKVRL